MNPIDNIMALHDEAAEARHVNGSPLYNTVSSQKRQALRAAIEQVIDMECRGYVGCMEDLEGEAIRHAANANHWREKYEQALGQGEVVALPEGWHIAKADNGQVLVSAPNCDPGSAWIKNQGPLPQRILYALVGAMLDAHQPQPDDTALCANEGVHELSGLLNTEADRLEHLLAPQPQREWVGLTDQDFREMGFSSRPRSYAAINAKLREKNAPESKVN